MKRLNRLILLSFLGILGGLAASGQALTSIRITLTDPDAKFIVDGQGFSYNQNFVWPEGTAHTVEFPMSNRANAPGPFQYDPSGRARWGFGGWTAVSSIPLTLPSTSVVTIIASRTLTELNGTVTKEFPVDVEFLYDSPAQGCTTTVEEELIDRQGVLLVDGACYAKGQEIWMKPGIHTFQAFPYTGYYFAGMVFGGGFKPMPGAFNLEINSTTTFGPVFERAKRVRFSTSPVGLQVLVDRAPVTPGLAYAIEPLSDLCGPAYIPLKTPLGVPHLCIGDFDFAPGSVHQIGAQPIQTSPEGDFWVFDSFSNGLGQSATFVTPGDVNNRSVIQAKFIHGVRSTISTSEAGLRLVIDGKDVPPSQAYGFIWAEGTTHRLSAPATQRDAKGRVWKFVRWSDAGAPEHDITVPVGGTDYRVSAFFEVLGQVQVTSNPPGLTVKVNGAECRTPCTYDQESGATLNMEAVGQLALGEGSRYEFDAWDGRGTALAQRAIFTADVQAYTARYHGSHRVLAYSDPEEGAKFRFSPESSDGFFAEGTSVQVTALPNTGYKFLVWDQDLNSRSAVERVTVVSPMTVVAKLEKVPGIAPAGVRNAAGDTPDGSVAPGSIISIYGDGLADELEIGPSNPLAQAIGDIYVTVNDRFLPLIFVSPSQINAQLLSSLEDGDYILKAHRTGKADMSGAFTVKRNAPGVFFNLTADGMPLVAALHQNGTPVTQASPARKGETISLFGTGLGGYDRPIIDGFLLPATEVYKLLDPVKVLAGLPGFGAPAGANAAQVPVAVRDPAFAGGAAGMVGTNLVKLTLDADLPAGKILELSLSVNGAQSNKVQLPVE